jgi:hypothetical protein
MKKVATIVSLAFLISYAGCKAQSNQKVEDEAISAAEAWLALVDNEKYGESWDEAAEIFKGAVTRDQWIQTMQTIRRSLGKTLGRELKSSFYRTTLPGAPDGEYVVIQFTTSFGNNNSTIETITPALDKEGKWRTTGYYIK